MKTNRVVFSRLTGKEEEALVDELVRWGLTIWHSNEAEMREYWMENRSRRSTIYLLRDNEGRLVGSVTFKYYDVVFKGRALVIVKMGVGASPGFRGNNLTLRSVATEVFMEKLFHPLEDLYFFSTLIHPVTYKLSCEVLQRWMYPHYRHPHPPELVELCGFLTRSFDIKKADSPYPFIYKERYTAIEPPTTRDYWRHRNHPAVRYFVEHCPNYDTGQECFIVLSPIRFLPMFFHTVKTVTRNRLQRRRTRGAFPMEPQ